MPKTPAIQLARLKVPGERDLLTIVGRFPDIHAGQTLRLTGYWRDHARYGQQFQVVHAQETKHATYHLNFSGREKPIDPFSNRASVTPALMSQGETLRLAGRARPLHY